MSSINKTANELLKDEKQLDLITKKAFDSYDNNKNGLLDLDEIHNILKTFAKQNNFPNPTKKECEVVFNSLDLNKDGKINYDEFKIFFTKYLKSSK
jgi:calcium-binding protein CML